MLTQELTHIETEFMFKNGKNQSTPGFSALSQHQFGTGFHTGLKPVSADPS